MCEYHSLKPSATEKRIFLNFTNATRYFYLGNVCTLKATDLNNSHVLAHLHMFKALAAAKRIWTQLA